MAAVIVDRHTIRGDLQLTRKRDLGVVGHDVMADLVHLRRRFVDQFEAL